VENIYALSLTLSCEHLLRAMISASDRQNDQVGLTGCGLKRMPMRIATYQKQVNILLQHFRIIATYQKQVNILLQHFRINNTNYTDCKNT